MSFNMLFLQPEIISIDYGLVAIPCENQPSFLELLLAKETLN